MFEFHQDKNGWKITLGDSEMLYAEGPRASIVWARASFKQLDKINRDIDELFGSREDPERLSETHKNISFSVGESPHGR